MSEVPRPKTKARAGLVLTFVQTLVIGLLAGLAVFLADALLAWLTLGYPVPIRPHFVAWYLAAGAVYSRPPRRWLACPPWRSASTTS